MRERKEIEENLVKEVNSKNDNVMQQLLVVLFIQNETLLDIRELLIEQKTKPMCNTFTGTYKD